MAAAALSTPQSPAQSLAHSRARVHQYAAIGMHHVELATNTARLPHHSPPLHRRSTTHRAGDYWRGRAQNGGGPNEQTQPTSVLQWAVSVLSVGETYISYAVSVTCDESGTVQATPSTGGGMACVTRGAVQ